MPDTCESALTCYNSAKRPKFCSFFVVLRIPFVQHAQMNMAFTVKIMTKGMFGLVNKNLRFPIIFFVFINYFFCS